MSISVGTSEGQGGKGVCITVGSSQYWEDHQKEILEIHRNKLSQVVT